MAQLITTAAEKAAVSFLDWDDEYLLEQVSDLEGEYGVHDFGASGDQNGTWTEFGYNSYEIRHDKWNELAQKWHDWFVSQGFNSENIQIK